MNKSLKNIISRVLKFKNLISEGTHEETANLTKRDPILTKQNRYLKGRIALKIVVKFDFDFGEEKP